MTTRLPRRSLLCALLLATLVACGQRHSESGAERASDAQATPAAAAADARVAATNAPAAPPPPAGAVAEAKEVAASPAASVPVSAQLTSAATTVPDGQRQFIRTAHAEFRVKDVYRSALAIEDIVAAHGGFVVSNDITTQTGNTQRRARGDGKLVELAEFTTRGVLVVRVPSAKTQAFLLAIAGQVDFLDRRTFQSNDAQFDLLRQMLAWQRGQEGQAELGQAEQRGGHLDERTETIQMREQAKAARDEALVQKKEFEDRVAFSTIDLSLYQTPQVRATEMVDAEAVFRANRAGFGERLALSLHDGWNGFLDVVVAFAAAWPFWLLVVAGLLVGRVLFKRRTT